jgi:hypothetical protein
MPERVVAYIDGYNLYELQKPDGYVLRRPDTWR